MESSNNESNKIDKDMYQREINLIRAMMTFNSFIPISPFADTTAIQTGDLLYRSFSYSETSRVAELYMLNSKSTRHRLTEMYGINLYTSPVATATVTKNEERLLNFDKIIRLSNPAKPKGSLEKSILQRRSHRKFSNMTIPLDRISAILRYGNGVSGMLKVEAFNSKALEPTEIKLRTAPSGGALYPLYIYLISLNVQGLEKGIYEYFPVDDSLILINDDLSLSAKVNSCFDIGKDIIEIENIGFIILIVGNLWKSIRKYGNRGLKYMFIETGEISQNIHLVANSLGLGTVDIAGYYDTELEALIDIDGINEYIMHSIMGGVPTD